MFRVIFKNGRFLGKLMGRIRTKYIKRMSRKINQDFGTMFSSDFVKNKESIKQVADIYSKKLRNKIAGCLVQIKNKERSTTE